MADDANRSLFTELPPTQPDLPDYSNAPGFDGSRAGADFEAPKAPPIDWSSLDNQYGDVTPAFTPKDFSDAGNVFATSLNSAILAGNGTAQHDANAVYVAQRNKEMQDAGVAPPPNPYNGGFNDEAKEQALQRWNDENPDSVLKGTQYAHGAAAQYEQDIRNQLWDKARADLAKQYQNNPAALAAINADVPLAQGAISIAQRAQQEAASAWEAASGSPVAYGAAFAGGMAGALRDPMNFLALAVPGLGEAKAASAGMAMLETGAKQAMVNMGLTALQEPGVQDWQKQLGNESGLVPALKDIGMAGVYGFVPGALVEGIKRAGAAFGSTGIDEFLRQARGFAPDPDFEKALTTFNGQKTDYTTRGAVWRKEIDDFISKWDEREAAGENAAYPQGREAPPPGRAPSEGPAPAPAGEQLRLPGPPPKAPEPPVFRPPPRLLNKPSDSSLTPTQIQAAQDDLAAAPPLLEGVTPDAHLLAYNEAIAHAEDPENVGPPVPPMVAPPGEAPVIKPDQYGAPTPTPGTKDEIDGKPISYTTFDARTLGTDANAFQYKGGGDQSGVTPRLRGVQRWNPLASGNTVVFERNDGTRIIVDGHQRLGLANRLMNEGKAANINFNGALLREADGWTAADARALAAKKNIQEGSGEPLDIARVLRDRPDMFDDTLPTTSDKLVQAKGLAELSDSAWGMMLNNAVPQNYAALVGRMVPDKSLHGAVMEDLANFKPKNENEARMMIADAMNAGFRNEMQESLFGPEEATRSLFKERAQVYSSVIQMLHDDKRVFAVLDNEAERITAAGNQLVDTNADRSQRAAQLASVLIKLAERAGPISAALNRAAATVVDGAKPKAAARLFLNDLTRLIEQEGLRLDAPPMSAIEPPNQDLDTPQGRQAQTEALEAENAAYQPAGGRRLPTGTLERLMEENGGAYQSPLMAAELPKNIETAQKAYTDASAAYTEATRAYRAKEIGDDEFIAARQARDEAMERLDALQSAEQLFALRAGAPTRRGELTERFADLASKLEPLLRAELDRLGLNDVGLHLVDAIEFWKDDQKIAEASGSYNRAKQAMTLALNSNADELMTTLHHEGLHALRSLGLFKDSEWNLLIQQSRKEWRTRYSIDRDYSAWSEDARDEEGVAHAYADWALGKTKVSGQIAKVFKRIQDFFEAVRNVFHGLGFKNPEDIFAEIKSGEMGQRPRPTIGGEGEPESFAAKRGGLQAEPGAEGLPQTLIPGVKPVTDADRLALAAKQPLRGGAAPMPAGGLFDEGARAQTDLLDMVPLADGRVLPRDQALNAVPEETVLAKFVGECGP